MTKYTLLSALLIAGPFSTVGLPPPTSQVAEPPSIVGTWRVVSVETIRPNGEALTDWLGKRPTGTIVYLPSGYMSVQIMRDPRPIMGASHWDQGTPSEKIAAADGYYAYYGTYRVDAQSRTVTHRVEASLRPREVGIIYERQFQIAGDRLTLTTPPTDRSRESRFSRLVWERVR